MIKIEKKTFEAFRDGLRIISENQLLDYHNVMPASKTNWANFSNDDFEFVSIVQSLIYGEDIEGFLQEAMSTNDTRLFEKIAKVSSMIKEPAHTKFSRSVVLALSVKLHLHRKFGRLPTKIDVIKLANKIARENLFEAFHEDEKTRWTEVFRVAQLTHLPRAKPKRGASRNRK
jgi:hypothetical protein